MIGPFDIENVEMVQPDQMRVVINSPLFAGVQEFWFTFENVAPHRLVEVRGSRTVPGVIAVPKTDLERSQRLNAFLDELARLRGFSGRVLVESRGTRLYDGTFIR